ncbi:MAG TPA: SulP family inorganic anion transporter [Acidimicrobiales bacterium]|nr:SulP family inorganic anion transporter [Acidimicrobiales bacterium]
MSDAHHEPRGLRNRIGDVVGGFVAGLYSVPEGIGYASLAGINPMFGIFAGMVPVTVAAATTGSVLMMSTLTSAIALTLAGVLDEGSFAPDQIGRAVLTMTLLAGVIMVVLGALKLGRIVNFVSNAVMTGFVAGVAVLILVGKANEVVGYDPEGHTNKLVKAVVILAHPGQWDATTALVGFGTIVAAFGLKAIPRLERYALVLVVAAGTAIVWIFAIHTATIADQAVISTGLDAVPLPRGVVDLPSLSLIPGLLVGSLSIAIVALAQGAGIGSAFPNPDGSKADASRDFTGQGIGNLAGAFFQAAPTGGSLSRTAVSAEGGARHRLAGFVAAASVLLLVVFAGSVVAHIPEAVIGGLLVVIGVELVVGRLPDARLAYETGVHSWMLFLVTLVLTLTVPLQWAILAGAGLSLLAYVAQTAASPRLRRIEHDEDGWRYDDSVPAVLNGDDPVYVRFVGSNFFAAVPAIIDQLPHADPERPGVVIVDLGEMDRYSSTLLKRLSTYVSEIREAGSGAIFVGVGDRRRTVLERTGLIETIGSSNVLGEDSHIDRSLERANERGRELLDDLHRTRSGGTDSP